MEIKNSAFVITGANRGIGLAVAEMAASNGASLILANRTEDPTLSETLLKKGALKVQILKADLSTQKSTQKLIDELSHLDIDILFNNAGQLTGGLLEDQPIDDIYSMLQVNVNALIHLTQGVLPKMLLRKKGKIINNASVSSVMNFPCASTYSASKAAVLAFTNCLKAELQGTGVSTLALITPGIETRMYKDIPKKYGKNMDTSFLTSVSPKIYAEQIKEAILEDLTELRPDGISQVGLLMAQHTPGLFQKFVRTKFKRQS